MSQLTFPNNFLWGAATAAYQIEGAAREDGRGESIWDRFCKTPGNVENDDTGDVACDHYHHFEEDIKLMKTLGLQAYRLSISWPRVFPQGRGEINPKGLDFYRRLLTLLVENGIKPMVTLYHWDLPQAMQEIGGWQNREVVDCFEAYARRMFTEFGGLVHSWITLNEPYVSAFTGNWFGTHAPGYHDFQTALSVAHGLLLGHGKVVKAFHEMKLPGEIGITLNMNSYYPKTNSPEDIEAAEFSFKAWNGWFSDPIYKGAYPKEVVKLYEERGVMPRVLPGDMETIAQPIDFLGINNYFSQIASSNPKHWPVPIEDSFYGKDHTEMGWGVNPEGIHDLLVHLSEDYNYPKLYITENGAAFRDMVNSKGEVEDTLRVEYLTRYLSQLHRAVEEGVNLQAYFAWSLMDNFEWAHGYSKRFGIIHIDYETQKRTIKQSGYWYANVIKNNGFTL